MIVTAIEKEIDIMTPLLIDIGNPTLIDIMTRHPADSESTLPIDIMKDLPIDRIGTGHRQDTIIKGDHGVTDPKNLA
jgi:hypothetical protein